MSLGKAVPHPDLHHSSQEEISPTILPEPPVVQPNAIASHPISLHVLCA